MSCQPSLWSIRDLAIFIEEVEYTSLTFQALARNMFYALWMNVRDRSSVPAGAASRETAQGLPIGDIPFS
jgi:hypothetical protein